MINFKILIKFRSPHPGSDENTPQRCHLIGWDVNEEQMSRNGGWGKRIPSFRCRECRLSDPVPVPRHPQQFSVMSQRPDLHHVDAIFFSLFFSFNFFIRGGPIIFYRDAYFNSHDLWEKRHSSDCKHFPIPGKRYRLLWNLHALYI